MQATKRKAKFGKLAAVGLALLSGVSACERAAQADAAEQWRPLFDGETLNGWTGVNGSRIGDAWQVVDGNLVLTAGGAGDLVSAEKFADFELQLEWKISERGNSGIIYRVADEDAPVWMSGMEYQVLDNAAYPELEKPSHSAGALFDLYAPSEEAVRPTGEFNSTKIRVEDGRVEHWLNGRMIVSYQLWSEDWRARLADSKFSDYQQFARTERGHIALQDHGDKVWYRNIKIREL
ncbi:protein of unknown function [Microbulbifer donghaiensis]|uniref:3-keto-alpha-glucoside-1,2-lyase/3-keto-2-hydroxy-glucal hydratase domain-containing protein n=1 Tax=Microbulbifer donghaiensis TaxID=494016 RepID=A0A1M5I363_9GAMM|nr:DUF1080 domain-containing protein [Microbulbifer donghaiensis]SHG22642.1 protein of unknown function [Microbulbifer donghaiensis]